MAFEALARLPWSLILATTSILTVYVVYRRRPDLFERFGFGTREVTFVTLLPLAGWAVNVPLLVLGRSTVALNLGGALVPVLLSGWIVHRGHVRRGALVVTVVATAVTALVAFEVVEFVPSVGIVAEFPWFFLPPMAASGLTLLLLARDHLVSVPAAYIAGSIGALVGADLMHMGEVGPYILASTEVAVLSVGGAGALDMVFLSGILAMAFNLVVVAAVNPPPPAPEPGPGGDEARPAFAVPPEGTLRYPAGLALVPDPPSFVVDVDRRSAQGRYVPRRDRVLYHLARGDVAIEAGHPARAVEQAQQAVQLALEVGGGRGAAQVRGRTADTGDPLDHPDLRRDVETVLAADPRTASAERARRVLVTAKLVAGVLGMQGGGAR